MDHACSGQLALGNFRCMDGGDVRCAQMGYKWHYEMSCLGAPACTFPESRELTKMLNVVDLDTQFV